MGLQRLEVYFKFKAIFCMYRNVSPREKNRVGSKKLIVCRIFAYLEKCKDLIDLITVLANRK